MSSLTRNEKGEYCVSGESVLLTTQKKVTSWTNSSVVKQWETKLLNALALSHFYNLTSSVVGQYDYDLQLPDRCAS